jgi:hypothetical protein
MFISELKAAKLTQFQIRPNCIFLIRLSANKMQKLLIDLVNYSRTIKGDKVYVDIDLSETIHRAIDELIVRY